MHLPPSELSKHAVELEKRAIQLTIEEGRQHNFIYFLVSYMEHELYVVFVQESFDH